MKRTIGAILALSTAVTIWGTVGVVVNETTVTGGAVAWYRCVIGAVALVAVYTLNGKRISVFAKELISDKSVAIKAFIASCLVALNWAALFEGINRIGITDATTIYYLQPVLLPVLAIAWKIPIRVAHTPLLILAFLGVFLVLGGQGVTLDGGGTAGMMFAFLAALFYAAGTLIARQVTSITGIEMAILQCFVGSLILLPAFFDSSLPNRDDWFPLMAIGLVHTALAYVLFFGAIRHVGVIAIGVLGYIDIVIAVGLDASFYGRSLGLPAIVGLVLVVFSGIGVALLEARKLLVSQTGLSAARN